MWFKSLGTLAKKNKNLFGLSNEMIVLKKKNFLANLMISNRLGENSVVGFGLLALVCIKRSGVIPNPSSFVSTSASTITKS